MSRLRRTIIPLLIIVVVLVLVQTVMRGNSSSSVKYAYQGGSQSFVSQLNSDDVSSVLVNTTAQTIQVTPTSGHGPTYTISYPDDALLAQLLAKHPDVAVSAKSGGSAWTGLLTLLLPLVLIIGFMIFIPFMVIDLVVSSILMSMGMYMLPPTLISLPFKILLFVLVDGWTLVVGSLLKSFHG